MVNKLLPLLIGIVVLIFILPSCVDKHVKKESIRPVKYLEITSAMTGTRVKTFSGVLQSDISTKLSFKVPGNIKTLNFEEGDYVKSGDVIATLDNELYVLQFEDAQASVGEAKSRYVNAKKYYARLAKLYVDGAISDRQLDDAKAEAEASANALKSAQKKSDYAKLRLDYTVLKAPMDGYIASVDTEINENLLVGATVVKLISSRDTEVKINMPESYVNNITKGEKVLITVGALNDAEFEGVIRDIGVDASKTTSTFPVTVTMKNPSDEVKSGMSADVIIKIKKSCVECITLPLNAVLDDKKGQYVYILEPIDNEKSKVVRIPVETGELGSDGIEIKSGIQPGDKVIIAGISKISEGLIVKAQRYN